MQKVSDALEDAGLYNPSADLVERIYLDAVEPVVRALQPTKGAVETDGWWRVIRPDGVVIWTDRDPRALLYGAWQDAKVEGPFVLATPGSV